MFVALANDRMGGRCLYRWLMLVSTADALSGKMIDVDGIRASQEVIWGEHAWRIETDPKSSTSSFVLVLSCGGVSEKAILVKCV